MIDNATDCNDNESIVSALIFRAHLSPSELVESVKGEIAKADNVQNCCQPGSKFGQCRIWNLSAKIFDVLTLICKSTCSSAIMFKVLDAPRWRVQIWQYDEVDQHYNDFDIGQPLFLELVVF